MTPTRRRTPLLLTLALCLAAALAAVPACSGPQKAEPESTDPEAPIQAGLTQLHPYDLSSKTTAGIRWLDNYALNHPQSISSHRARYWILRARVDWLTLAYVEEDPEARVESLTALMEHLGLPAEGEIGNDDVFAVVDALEKQARGVEKLSGYEQAAASALHFLSMFRHLDLSPGYFEAVNALGVRGRPPKAGPPFEPMGPQDFALNALLVVMADLGTHLPAVAELDMSRRAHGYARVLAYSCPKGLSAFASADLEERRERLVEGCDWPCGSTPMEGKAPWDACPRLLASSGPTYSLDNEVTLRALAELTRLRRTAAATNALGEGAAEVYPVLRGRPELLPRLLKATDVRDVPLSLPAHGESASATGVPLLPVRYAPFPTVALAVVVYDGESVSVAANPWATSSGGAGDPLQPGLAEADPRSPWDFPGKKLGAAPEVLAVDRAPLTESLSELLAAQAEVHGTNKVDLLASDDAALTPVVIAPPDTAAPTLRVLLKALADVGFTRAQVAVRDPSFHRPGAFTVNLVDKPAGDAPLITVGDAALTLKATPTGKPRAEAERASSEAPLPVSELYLALFPMAAGAKKDLLPKVTLAMEGGTLADLVHTVDAIRYWRQVPEGASGLAVLEAEPQDAGGVPRVMVAYFDLPLAAGAR